MEYADISTALIVLLGACGALTVIAGAVNVIKSWRKPTRTVNERLDKHEAMLTADKKRLDTLEADSRVTLTCIGAILDHEITGNSVDKLKKAREELTEHLIQR